MNELNSTENVKAKSIVAKHSGVVNSDFLSCRKSEFNLVDYLST